MSLVRLLMIINNKRKRKMKINIKLFRKLSILLSFSLFSLSLLKIIFNPAAVSVNSSVRDIKCDDCEPDSMNSLSFNNKLLFGDIRENFLDQLCPIISPLLGKISKYLQRFSVVLNSIM